MKWIIIAFIFIAQITQADIVKIETDPKEPVLGDSFNVIFKIEAKETQNPEINFETQNVQVDSKNFSGRSTRTTFFNGKLMTESTLNYSYQLTPLKAGNAYLKNITVNVDGQTFKHPNVRIRILKKPRVQKVLFLAAEVSKDQAFIGESVIVNYYVYGRVAIQNFTIKKFPKLNNFLKRYQPERNTVERVTIGNHIYQRRLLYSAQVFPEKTGDLKIDSMTLQVQYVTRGNNPFGNFGLSIGSSSLKNKTIKSPTVSLNVLPLPTVDMPKGFTGLVGKHNFKLEMNKSKFLLNEPLEIKLKVEGPGALENFDAPTLLTNAGLEEFDTKANLELSQNFTGTKTFEYVYLTRAPFEQPAKKITLAYFDPEQKNYESVDLDLPEIKVVGQAVNTKTNNQPLIQESNLKKENENFQNNGSTIIAPIIVDKPFFSLTRINLGLLIFILISFIYRNRKIFVNFNSSERKKTLKKFLKGDLSYHKLINLLRAYDQNFDSFKDFLNKSDIDKKTRQHLEKLLEQCEQNEFSPTKPKKKVRVKKKHLKQFIDVLENGRV